MSDETGSPEGVVLATSDYRPGPKSDCRFRESWRFKGDAIPRILALLDGAPHPWVHVCCGSAYIPGEDLRVDLHHPSATLKVDAAVLDKHVRNAGAVIMDPPYGWDLALRQRACNAAMRALRPGGRLILHAPWIPKFNRVASLDALWWREDSNLGFPQPPVMLAAWTKNGALGRTRRGRQNRASNPEEATA